MKKTLVIVILLISLALLLASTAAADTNGDPDPIYVVLEPGDTLVFVCPFHDMKLARYDATSGFAKCSDD